MLFSALTFGSVGFFICVGIFCLLEMALFFNRVEREAIVLAVIFTVAMALITSDWPRISWHIFAVYFAGAFVWVPIYWYMTLHNNRMKLLELVGSGKRRWDSSLDEYGVFREGKQGSEDQWLPKHPTKEAIAANGLMWFFAGPIFIAENWIRWVIDLFTRLMNKAQLALAVDLPAKDEERDSK